MLRRDFLKYLSATPFAVAPITGALLGKSGALSTTGESGASEGQPEGSVKERERPSCYGFYRSPGALGCSVFCEHASKCKNILTMHSIEYSALEIDGETHWFDDCGNEYYYAWNHPMGKIKDLPISFYRSVEI